MRHFATTLLLVVIATTASLAQADTEVFRKVMEDYVLKNKPPHLKASKTMTVVILSKPSHDIQLTSADFGRFHDQCEKLDKSTFESFLEKAHQDFTAPDEKIQDTKIVTIEKFTDYKDLYKKYADYDGRLLEFTNVGLNSTGDQALVYYGWQQGPGVGGGVYLLYARKGTHWKLIKTFGAWAT